MEVVSTILIGIFILFCSIEDIKRKQISLSICIVFSVVGVIIGYVRLDKSVMFFLVSIIPAIIIAMISIITRGGIGMGDALVIGVVGLYLGMKNCLLIFMVALLISGIYGAYLLIVKKRNGKDNLSFVPFVLCGFLIIQGGII